MIRDRDAGVIQDRHEIDQSRTIVDSRTLYKKMWDGLQAPTIPFVWAVIAAIITLLWPGFIPFGLLIQIILWYAVVSKPDVLPIHLPMEANKKDLNDEKPGGSGHYKARGSFFMGNIRTRGSLKWSEVWISFKSLTQHFLIFGTTGAGKTESIVSYISNFLSVGSGVAFQDAKAAPKAMLQIATFCRIFGRDDDFRVTNYITGGSSKKRDPAERISNDAAIFARGSAESSTQLLVSLLPKSEGDNKIFSERAISLVSSLLPALTDLRDIGKLQIDPGIIRDYMAFKMFATLFRNNNISKKSRDALKGFLESLPGYDENVDIGDQKEEVTRQFGFSQAYFTRSLASLSDTYGHIYMVGLGEIDYQDAVLNGRILMTLLPSMEKSGEELSSLGKIVLTATRNGMVVGLGTVFEGSVDDVVHNLPTNSDIPYGIMNDENAYMLVEGQEMINAQARGLGFSVMTGTQDAPGMLENISRTTKQIMANSAIKQIMYLDDKETTDLAVEFSGEANVMVRDNYEREGDLGDFFAGSGARVEKRHRLTSTAIKAQGLGQAFIMYQGKTHAVQVYNHGINEKGSDPLTRYVDSWYSVRMAKIAIPTVEELLELNNLSPSREYQDLLVMIRDDSRKMLASMNLYFHSMLVIERLAKQTLSDNDKERMFDKGVIESVYGARDLLEADYNESELVGLLRRVVDADLDSKKSVAELFISLLRDNESPSFIEQKQQALNKRLAKETNITMPDMSGSLLYDETEGDIYMGDDDSEEETDSGNTGGTGSLSSKPSPKEEVDPLNAYLGMEITGDGNDEMPESYQEDYNHYFDGEIPDEMPAEESEYSRSEALTPIAEITRNALALMPWFGSVNEVDEARAAMVQTELFMTNSADESKALSAVNDGFEMIASAFTYPKTKMPNAENVNLDSLLSNLKSD